MTSLADRYRIDTPQPATPEAMAVVVRELVEHFEWTGPVGVGFPAVVRNGVVGSAANIDESWIDVDADALFSEATGLDVHMINDADAAGVAEVRFGAGRGRSGVVMMLTFGTGIGSGLFIDGVLVPNTELGHLEIDGHDAESRAAASARDRHAPQLVGLGRAGARRYLRHVERLFSPDLFIVGGGASKQSGKWLPQDPHRHRDRAGADGQQRRHRRRRAQRASCERVNSSSRLARSSRYTFALATFKSS